MIQVSFFFHDKWIAHYALMNFPKLLSVEKGKPEKNYVVSQIKKKKKIQLQTKQY